MFFHSRIFGQAFEHSLEDSFLAYLELRISSEVSGCFCSMPPFSLDGCSWNSFNIILQLLFAASGKLILTLMASQPVGGREDITSLEVQSYIRGYHAYQDIWDPCIGEVLLLQREPDNPEDKFAVGHLPFNLAPVVSAFLRRDINKGLVEV